MKLIVCVDNKGGMLFSKKRQSEDGVLRQKLLSLAENNRFFVSEYTSGQFEDFDKITVIDPPFDEVGDDDFLFAETEEIFEKKPKEIILCRWNRDYPADCFFDINLAENGFFLADSENITGSSHDKITIERYIKNG